MRYLILAPICAALLGAAAANAQDSALGFSDVQAYGGTPDPVAAPVPPHLISGPQMATAPGACDAHLCGCRPHAIAPVGPALLPYHAPMFPPPATLYGYFNSPPEHMHVWDNYPREVALRHWHRAVKERQLRGDRQHRVRGGHLYGEPCQ